MKNPICVSLLVSYFLSAATTVMMPTTYSCYSNGPNMVPAKGGFIDLRQGQPASLVGIGDVSEIVVEVVEGKIATRSHVLLDRCGIGVHASFLFRG